MVSSCQKTWGLIWIGLWSKHKPKRNKLNICNGHQSVYGDGKHGNAYDDDDGDDDDDDESHLLLSSVKHSIENIILNGRPQYCHNDDLGRLALVAKLI